MSSRAGPRGGQCAARALLPAGVGSGVVTGMSLTRESGMRALLAAICPLLPMERVLWAADGLFPDECDGVNRRNVAAALPALHDRVADDRG